MNGASPFYLKEKNLWRSTIFSGRNRRDPGSLRAIWFSSFQEIGWIFSGSLNTHHPEGLLEKARDECPLWGIKKRIDEEPQGLADTCLQSWWGAVMWPSCPSDQSSRPCLCGEKSMDTAASMLLFPSFFFFNFSSQGFRIYWVALFLKGHFFSKILGRCVEVVENCCFCS